MVMSASRLSSSPFHAMVYDLCHLEQIIQSLTIKNNSMKKIYYIIASAFFALAILSYSRAYDESNTTLLLAQGGGGGGGTGGTGGGTGGTGGTGGIGTTGSTGSASTNNGTGTSSTTRSNSTDYPTTRTNSGNNST